MIFVATKQLRSIVTRLAAGEQSSRIRTALASAMFVWMEYNFCGALLSQINQNLHRSAPHILLRVFHPTEAAETMMEQLQVTAWSAMKYSKERPPCEDFQNKRSTPWAF